MKNLYVHMGVYEKKTPVGGSSKTNGKVAGSCEIFHNFGLITPAIINVQSLMHSQVSVINEHAQL